MDIGHWQQRTPYYKTSTGLISPLSRNTRNMSVSLWLSPSVLVTVLLPILSNTGKPLKQWHHISTLILLFYMMNQLNHRLLLLSINQGPKFRLFPFLLIYLHQHLHPLLRIHRHLLHVRIKHPMSPNLLLDIVNVFVNNVHPNYHLHTLPKSLSPASSLKSLPMSVLHYVHHSKQSGLRLHFLAMIRCIAPALSVDLFSVPFFLLMLLSFLPVSVSRLEPQTLISSLNLKFRFVLMAQK